MNVKLVNSNSKFQLAALVGIAYPSQEDCWGDPIITIMEPSCNTSEGDLPFIDLPIIDIVKLNGQSGDVEKTKETQKLIDAFTEVRNSRCVR